MKDEHLPETAIQQFAIDGFAGDDSVKKHLLTCESCNEKVKNYLLLFSALREIPAPAFEFNLSELVIQQLPVPATARAFSWTVFMGSFLTVALLAGLSFFFREYLLNLFKGISMVLLCLIMVSGFIILIFQGLDIYKNYQRKIDILNFY